MRPIGIDACAQMVQATAHTGRAKQRSAARWPLQSGFRRARAHCACGRSAFAPKGSVGHLQAANLLDEFVTASTNGAWSHARDPRRLSFPLSRLRPLRPPPRREALPAPAHQNPPNIVSVSFSVRGKQQMLSNSCLGETNRTKMKRSDYSYKDQACMNLTPTGHRQAAWLHVPTATRVARAVRSAAAGSACSG